MAPSSSAGEKHQIPNSRQTTPKNDQYKFYHEQRRRTFLHKVRQKGEDKKWDIRGEQILREDFLTAERHWIESQNRSAPPAPVHPEDDDMEGPILVNEHQADGLFDQVLSQENEEVDALVSLFEGHTNEASHGAKKRVDYGSDDEKYDSIFLDLLSSTSNEAPLVLHTKQVFRRTNDEALATETMDTSGG